MEGPRQVCAVPSWSEAVWPVLEFSVKEPDRVLCDCGRWDTGSVGLRERGGWAERERGEVRAGDGEESSLCLGLGRRTWLSDVWGEWNCFRWDCFIACAVTKDAEHPRSSYCS